MSKSKGKLSKGGSSSWKTQSSKRITEPKEEFINGSGKFAFPNGDLYEGDYCAHISGLVWREGSGTYTTKDGHVYVGKWYNDKIVENSEIMIYYPSGVKYMGTISKNKYQGKGSYRFANGIILNCQFVDNKPSGLLTAVDLNGNPWIGVSADTESTLLQEHLFYRDLDEEMGIGKSRIFKLPPEESIQEESYHPEEDVFDQHPEHIFKHSTLTEPDVNFYDSQWYQNYIQFKFIHHKIMSQVIKSGAASLPLISKDWFESFQNFKEDYNCIIMKRKKSKEDKFDEELFDMFNQKKYKKTCPPISVIYPNIEISKKTSASDIYSDTLENISYIF